MIEDKEKVDGEKLYSWIMGLINIYRPKYREEFAPLWDMIRETIETDESNLKSTITCDGETYEFNINLKRVVNGWDKL